MSRAQGLLGLVLSACVVAGGCGSSLASHFLRVHAECGGRVTTAEWPALPMVYEAQGGGIRDTLFQVRGSDRINAASEAVQRAAFETGCPLGTMMYTVLARDQVGVHGCATRRVYISTASGWMLNAETTDPSPAGPTAPAGYGWPSVPPAPPTSY